MPSNNANINTTLTVPEESQKFYDRTLLTRLLPELVFARYGQKRRIPAKAGKTVNFRRFTPLDKATTPLTEGVTPEGKTLNVDEVEATLAQYGDYVEITDILDLTGIDPVATETSELLGEQAGGTIDTVVRDIVCAGTNVQYAGGVGSSSAVVAKISSEEVKKAARTLKKANAPTLEGGAYIGIVDPDISFDLQNDPLWQDVSKYNGGANIMDGEIGKLGGVRFIETTETLTKEGGKVHCAMIIGKDAYGVVDINGSANKPKIIIKPFGSSGTEDPLNQRQTQGWKALFTAVRLNELAMVRLEVAVSE
ncbi:MAG: N4-gp56 family major capsid protein [Clostridia bacterium]|nr:N4-gp56 family major capsid protein [Clostridia bacterium]